MLKRLNIYLKEMYPVIPRLLLSFLLMFEVYFLVLFTAGRINFTIGIQEFVCAFTIFAFLLSLRIADELKDYETDLVLFPHRAYPSGRVLKKDLISLLSFVSVIAIALNLIFMDNLIYFSVLVGYGLLMSVWFFKKHVIQKNLVLALITHNPIQLIMNIYIISFVCIKYDLALLTVNNFVILFTLYFPGLIWELSRKVRAPEEETEYVTYSRLFGYKKMTIIIMAIMFLDLFSSSFLVYQLFNWSVVTVILAYLFLVIKCLQFIKNPLRFKLVKQVELYVYMAESSVVAIVILFILKNSGGF